VRELALVCALLLRRVVLDAVDDDIDHLAASHRQLHRSARADLSEHQRKVADAVDLAVEITPVLPAQRLLDLVELLRRIHVHGATLQVANEVHRHLTAPHVHLVEERLERLVGHARKRDRGAHARLRLRLPGEELEDLLVPATLAVAGELEHLLLAELLGRLLEDGENEVLVLDRARSEVVPH